MQLENPDGEIPRIRAAYEHRAQTVPPDRYSLFKQENFLLHVEVLGSMLHLLRGANLIDLGQTRILDVGCGRGYWLRQFIQWGARPSRVVGIDLLQHRIAEARELCPPQVNLHFGDAAGLPFEGETFDLVTQFTVFTSILDTEMKKAVASEMTRVLRPGGVILWYDYFVSNPRNPDVRGVTKAEIRRLFPGLRVVMRRITLAPPIGRAVGARSSILYHLLSSCKLLCTHYLGLFHKP